MISSVDPAMGSTLGPSHLYAAYGNPDRGGNPESAHPPADDPRVDRDRVTLSQEARALHEKQKHLSPFPSDEEMRLVEELKRQDIQVRAHEWAHLAAAGGLAQGGATFVYQRGPDGRNYAVGGEVSLDTSPVPGNPEATLRKAQTIRAAALAPATPSAQDRAVAAAAGQMEARAQLEKQQQQRADNPEKASPYGAIDRVV